MTNILCKCGLHRMVEVKRTKTNFYEECSWCEARKYSPVDPNNRVPVVDFKWLTEGGRLRDDPLDKVFTVRQFRAASS